MTVPIEPPICVALDTPDLAAATALVDALAGSVKIFKVGLTLYTAHGPKAVQMVHDRGAQVFLDLKLSDIPRQVAGAVKAASRLGVAFLTIHSNAGRATVRAAVDATSDDGPKLLVVSVLTSLNDADISELGIARAMSDQVDAMAQLAVSEGAPGVVLSSRECKRVRSVHPGLFLLVPGIRREGSAEGDQKRIGTPGAVIRDGADLLVVGRDVTTAPDPVRVVDVIVGEIEEARAGALS
jgi:orotidine-5'-phosphate decarboxylase